MGVYIGLWSNESDISHAGFRAGFDSFSPFLSFLGILLSMGGFSLPDIPTIMWDGPPVEAAR